MSSSIKLTNATKWLLIIIFAPVLSVSFTSFIFNLGQQMAFAQESAPHRTRSPEVTS